MLGDAGSIASLAGVVVSIAGLGFAIWHILRLRGEARAAREAAEETRQTVSRDTASATLTRVSERIEGLKELHRQNEWDRALDRYPELRRMLVDIRYRHPQLSEEQRAAIQAVVATLLRMENEVGDARGTLAPEKVSEFYSLLTESQASLAEIESQLQRLD